MLASVTSAVRRPRQRAQVRTGVEISPRVRVKPEQPEVDAVDLEPETSRNDGVAELVCDSDAKNASAESTAIVKACELLGRTCAK